MWLIVFDQLLNTFSGSKSFPEVTGGGRYFFEYSERVKGLTLSCENGKSGRVGDLLNSLRGGGLDIFWKHTFA